MTIAAPLLAAALCLAPLAASAQGAITETRFASAGGWSVVRGVIGGRIDYCAATRSFGARAMRLSWDGSAWILAVNDARAPGDFSAEMEIGDEAFTLTGASDGMWSHVTLPPPALAAIRAGRTALLEKGEAQVELPLDGTAAAIASIRSCAAR